MKALFILAILFTSTVAYSQSWWSIEPLRTGSAKSFSTKLEIEQTAFPKFEFDADYETRPWEDAPYYGWRISRQSEKHAWELEFLHHKIYLTNNPPEIQHFEVSHGYNMLFLNHAWIFGPNYIRAGAGPVISHTESEIRGLGFASNYEISGFVGQGAFGRRFYLSRIFYFTLEGKFTLATASVSIAQGKAHAPNVAIHGLAGIGFDLGKKD
ncbi:hypothetical protein L0244_36590 [bacterium]|nr:hypothetical protein [bacterium]